MGLNFDGDSITFSDSTVQTTAFSGISISGSGYIEVIPDGNNYTISSSGLQPSGDYSLNGHTHVALDITDFDASVSGLLPAPISNPSGITGASAITNIVSISQVDYDALPSKDSSTLYVIT